MEERLNQMTTVFSDIESASEELKKQLQERECLETLEAELEQKLAALKEREQSLNEDTQFPCKEQSLEQQRHGVLDKAAWPAVFCEDGALCSWRHTILDCVAREDICATGLLLTLIKFEILCRQPEKNAQQIATALHDISLEAHKFWQGKGEFNDIAIRWRDGFNALLVERKVPIEVQAVYPQDRFDINCMVCAEDSSDSRLYVKEPLSWVILDKTNAEQPKVLRHGVVVTV